MRAESISLGVVALVATLLAAPASAQTVSVEAHIPWSWKALEGEASCKPFDARIRANATRGSRTLVIIDRSLLGPIAIAPTRWIALRRDVQMRDALAKVGWRGGEVELELRASWTTRHATRPSPNFALNHGKTSTLVYRGRLVVPSAKPLSRSKTYASFAAGDVVPITLQTPIPHGTAGGNLCLDFVVRPRPKSAAPSRWLIDVAAPPHDARVVAIGDSCHRSKAKAGDDAWITREALQLGGALECISSAPKGALPLLLVGANKEMWSGVRLPFDLTRLGAAGCLLAVRPDLVVLGRTRAVPMPPFAEAQTSVALPSLTRLARTRVYTQWLFLEPQRNALGLTLGQALEATLPSRGPALAASIVHAADAAATRGALRIGHCPLLLLRMRKP